MENLWAPWRMAYIRGEKPEGCVLCADPRGEGNGDNLVLFRGKSNFVIMNKYPYNPGHLMVAPYRHIATPEAFSDTELDEHYGLVRRCLGVLREAFNPSGFNLGMNLGKAAGAGIAEHCHTHIVPRWEGDTNFMPVTAGTRVISESIEAVYNNLKGLFSK
jgi:ATP adenylyltransferase